VLAPDVWAREKTQMQPASPDRAPTVHVRDDRGRTHRFNPPPRRIVSLVPSDTYSLVKLGATDRLVGRTRYCVAPSPDVDAIEVVGGTKDVDVERVIELSPDVVIANQEENTKRDVEALETAGVRVFVSFPRRAPAGVAHLARLLLLLGVGSGPSPARDLIASAYASLRNAGLRERKNIRVFVPIWMDPLMTANADTFLSDLLALVGATNVFADRERRYPLAADLGRANPIPITHVGDRDTRYPRVTLAEVEAAQPELVLLPDEPHPFSERDAEVFRSLAIPAARHGQIRFCDGKDLLWYGARSVEGMARLSAIVSDAHDAIHGGQTRADA